MAEPLARGKARRDPSLGELDVVAQAPLAIGEDVAGFRDLARPMFALYIGGMGAKGRNFYHNLATRYGFGEIADKIQELYLSGRKRDAIDLVPDELVRGMSLVGPRGFIAERLAAFGAAGVTTLLVSPMATDAEESMSFVEEALQLRPA